jgi:hypothetical protein
MKKPRHTGLLLWLSAGFWLLTIAPAHAYIDPGSGSLIFQVVVGGTMAVGLGLKIFWRRITSFFSRRRSSDEQ